MAAGSISRANTQSVQRSVRWAVLVAEFLLVFDDYRHQFMLQHQLLANGPVPDVAKLGIEGPLGAGGTPAIPFQGTSEADVLPFASSAALYGAQGSPRSPPFPKPRASPPSGRKRAMKPLSPEVRPRHRPARTSAGAPRRRSESPPGRVDPPPSAIVRAAASSVEHATRPDLQGATEPDERHRAVAPEGGGPESRGVQGRIVDSTPTVPLSRRSPPAGPRWSLTTSTEAVVPGLSVISPSTLPTISTSPLCPRDTSLAASAVPMESRPRHRSQSPDRAIRRRGGARREGVFPWSRLTIDPALPPTTRAAKSARVPSLPLAAKVSTSAWPSFPNWRSSVPLGRQRVTNSAPSQAVARHLEARSAR